VQQKLGITERRACVALGQSRGLQRRKPVRPDDEEALTADIIKLARRYGRYGYKRITALLRVEGWIVNHKRVERIWRQEALKVPQKHKKKGRLYLNDGSCIRLRPCWANHVWAYDFVAERLKDGTKIRTLTVIDEYTRECLSLRTDYSLKADDVMDVLTVFVYHVEVFRITSDQTTALSLQPDQSGHGCQNWGSRLCILSRDRRGRTAITKASMVACAMSS